MKVLYTATATTHGGRQGRVRSSDDRLDLKLAVPKEMGGDGDGTNPEQLFAAGYAACFESALRSIADKRNRPAENASITALIGVGRADGGGYGLEVELRASMPGVPREEAEDLVARAHKVCPYSNATRGNLDVKLTVE